jgi:hypothetical protein
MTKTLEEMLQATVPESEPLPNAGVINQPEESPEMVDSTVPEEADSTIPEHMYTDSGMVGYGDTQIQSDIYNLSTRGNIPLYGDTSILDIGAGRGDLLHHIKSQLPSLNVDYVGYETSKLLHEIGEDKIDKATFENFSAKIIQEDFLKAQIDRKFDLVYVIGTLNINYGTDVQPWDYLEMMMRKALDVTELGGVATFVLLHDTGGVDQYISYPIPNVSELIMKFNMPFSIDFGQIPSVYKLSIRKEPIFITQ